MPDVEMPDQVEGLVIHVLREQHMAVLAHQKLTWNPEMEVGKMIFRFHVGFCGCTLYDTNLYA